MLCNGRAAWVGNSVRLLILFVIFFFSYPANAYASSIAGRYVYSGQRVEDEARIRQAIDISVKPMNALLRPIARMKLTRRNVVISELELRDQNGNMFVRMDKKEATMPNNGVQGDYIATDGTPVKLSHRVSQDVWTQVYRGDGGTQTHVFTRQPDGILRMEVSVESKRLAIPLRYVLRFVPSVQSI